jgi:hypothetical protein
MMKLALNADVALALTASGASAMSSSARAVLRTCKPDIARLCGEVQPGGGRVKACMKEHLAELSEGCKEALFQACLQQ